MSVRRLEHVGVVVEDHPAATAFFLALGLEQESTGAVEGGWVDRIVGLEGVRSEITILRPADGGAALELTTFHAPAGPDGDPGAPSNAPGLRHVLLVVDDIDGALARVAAHGGELLGTVERYEDRFRLCYLRGPEGIIVELAQELGAGG